MASLLAPLSPRSRRIPGRLSFVVAAMSRNRLIVKSNSGGSQAAILKNHILPVLGSVEISEISSTHQPVFWRFGRQTPQSKIGSIAYHVRSRRGARSGRKQSRKTGVASATTYTQKDADLECWERSEHSPGNAGARKVLFWCIALTGVRVGELLGLQ